MATYNGNLPVIFPWRVTLTKEQAQTGAVFLIEHGSSFAITMDQPYTLWLSEESYRFLVVEKGGFDGAAETRTGR